MKITEFSKRRMRESADKWRVDDEYFQPMFNYLVYGFNPGSFFTSVLANDFYGAMMRSHPMNTVTSLKSLVGWIQDSFPSCSHGSYDNVQAWSGLTEEERRTFLEDYQLIFTEKAEVEQYLRQTS